MSGDRRCDHTLAGPLLDALGVRLPLAADQQLVEVIVIAKAISFGDDDLPRTVIVVGTSDRLDWIAQRGLVAVASDILADGLREDHDDDDDEPGGVS